MIANEQGVIIAATDPGLISQHVGDYPFLHGIADHESGYYDELRQGEKIKVIYNTCTTASNTISQYWKVISIIAVDNLLIGTRNTLRFGILICLLILLVMGVFTFILSKGITSRISKLVERTHLVSSGNFTEAVDIPGSDEIAELGQSFNIMVRDLNLLVNEVYEGKIKMQEYIIKKKEAELTALQNQINPHFLYNTLDAIRMHAIINNSESLADMLTSLSALLRYSVSRGKEIVTLADEIKHVTNYISIINMKHDNGVNLVTQIPEELLAAHILKLILQPIVENAFLHGIKGKMHTAEIRITGSIQDDQTIAIDIIDNGEGMSDERLKQINEKLASVEHSVDTPQGSIGLNNVNSRIKLYFGMMYGLTITSEYGAGTVVRIRIPYQIKTTPPDDKQDLNVAKDNEHA
jgi:two-component system sensor histidine kinase YesM